MDSNTTGSGLTMQYNIMPTKKEIIERLFKEEKINFDEMWVLLQESADVRYVVMPQPVYNPVPPFIPFLPSLPWTTCNTGNNITNVTGNKTTTDEN